MRLAGIRAAGPGLEPALATGLAGLAAVLPSGRASDLGAETVEEITVFATAANVKLEQAQLDA